jgi:GMP synthase (glutamine-hydrolysing)
MGLRPILLKTGSTMPAIRERRGDFEAWFADGFGWPVDRFHVVEAHEGAALPDPGGVDAVVVTGSAASVHLRPAWSVAAGEWLAEAVAAGIPTMAICYGHQLLADTLDGESGPSPNGREMGLIEVDILEDDPLFDGMPRRLPVLQTHSDAVNRAPTGARILAGNAHTPVQAMALGERCRAVQWHPEFDAGILRSYVDARVDAIDAELGAGAAARIREGIRDTPWGHTLLRNFERHFMT